MAVMARVDEVGGVRRRMITANGDPESGAAGQAAAAQCVFAEQETRHPSLSDCLLVVAQRTRPTTTPLSPSVGARRNHFHFIRFFSRARTWILIHHPPLLVGSLSRSSSAFRATMLLRLALCLSGE
uniref:Uncharacterized protein n=1 Tax=Plectus sambesii TaxID=2011161 RepID=A0A914WIX9_9BILA